MVDPIFHRLDLAKTLAGRLLRPSPIDTLRDGLFISGPRRTGKSTFLVQDLVPVLEASGAVVIYTDLWKAAERSPAEKLLMAVRCNLATLQEEGLQSLIRKARSFLEGMGIASAEVEGAFGVPFHPVSAKIGGKIKFNFETSSVGTADGESLADALLQVSEKTGRDIVFIVDEVQELLGDARGESLLKELKATRDAINLRPGQHGYFLFIGNGSHRARLHEMAERRTQAFHGAVSIEYPELGKEYVSHLLAQARMQSGVILPSEQAARSGFQALGNRPPYLKDALRTLALTEGAAINTDSVFAGIVSSLARNLESGQVTKIQDTGPLAAAVFDRICRGLEEGTEGLLSAEALKAYSQLLGRPVDSSEASRASDALRKRDLIRRVGRGTFAVSDPLVRRTWLDRRAQGADRDEDTEWGMS